MPTPSRLPETRPLNEILPKGREGGLEFARIVDLLLFHEARRRGLTATLFSDRTGDYHGLDSFSDGELRLKGNIGYQYKFHPSPLSAKHRKEIEASLEKARDAGKELTLSKWILVTPDDLTESASRKDGGDVTWFQGLRKRLGLNFEPEHWGHRKLQALFLETPSLCLFYYPELLPDGHGRRRTIEETRTSYDTNLGDLHGRIEFVGMSVYKPEATRGVAMDRIYIPLGTVAENADDRADEATRDNPLDFLHPPGGRHVILGDPGSGKSTLLKFMALAGRSKPLQKRYHAPADDRLPLLVVLRKYADALKSEPDLPLLDYIARNIQADFSLPDVDRDFLEYYLENCQALLLFDGMDELPNPRFKQTVRDRIHTLLNRYPGNSAVITSRIVGYEEPHRFDERGYRHHKVARLRLPEMERFVADWYAERIENRRERDANIKDLNRILREGEQQAIRDLAANPLLLTIIALVHRIDAVLPDERVVLYQKCTETLLNTWHNWKYAHQEGETRRGKIERRNRRRIEALAYWMHEQAGGDEGEQRAVVSYEAAHARLVEHIRQHERLDDPDDALDLAEGFLEFVRKRAGLLIEVGDRQYSFVHLTFQEYLTATHLIATTEVGGIDGLWERIESRIEDPRWHEVIRLLVANLKSGESQKRLLELLLQRPEEEAHTALLLGGLLLDGVEAAELDGAAIVRRLLCCTVINTDEPSTPKLLSVTRSIANRSAPHTDWVSSAFHDLWSNNSNHVRQRILVAGYAAEIDKNKHIDLLEKQLETSTQTNSAINLFLASDRPVDTKTEQHQIDRLSDLIIILATTSTGSNSIAAIAQSAFTNENSPKTLFKISLSLLQLSNINPFRYLLLIPTHMKHPNFQIRHWNNSNYWNNNQDRHRPLRAALRRINPHRGTANMLRHRARIRSKIDTIKADYSLDSIHDIAHDAITTGVKNDLFWDRLCNESEISSSLIWLLTYAFHLTPFLLWSSALHTRFLATIPSRLNLYSPETWNEVEEIFTSIQHNEVAHYSGAWMLLYDIWLYFTEQHDTPEDSPFARLAELTRFHPAPALRTAHCLRDLTYGDEHRTDDLRAMVHSDDPSYRQLFKDALWID